MSQVPGGQVPLPPPINRHNSLDFTDLLTLGPMITGVGCAGALATLAICGGLAAAALAQFDARSAISNRFQTDNANGATANAAEYIAQHAFTITPGEMIICGLLLILCAQMGVLLRSR